MPPLNDLALMIQSRYPFIAVETSEEDRLETTLSQVAGDLRVPFFVWTVTNGLHRYGLPNAIYDSQQPLKGLNNVAAMTGEATSTSARRRRISTMRCGWPSRWHPGGDADAGLSKRVFGRLLAWLQDRKAPVFVVATCNDIGQRRSSRSIYASGSATRSSSTSPASPPPPTASAGRRSSRR